MGTQDKPQTNFAEIMQGLALAPDGFRICHNEVLVGIYMAPEKTKGGIILTDKTRAEDQWQGKVGFVITKGPRAFVDDPDNRIYFNGVNPEIGESVLYRVSDGFTLDVNGIHCRLLEDVAIRVIVADPTIIY